MVSAPRAASTTAVLVCQGRAVADGRYAVGRFSDPVARALLDDGERLVVDAVRAGDLPEGVGERMAYEMVLRSGITMVPRTVTIDAAVRDHAAGQVVLLGAGLDGRAWRMPELAAATVYEVDHPASQADKRRRVEALVPLAGRVVAVPVDLAVDALGPALEAAGLDRGASSTWVWEGVVPYLTAAAVRRTVAQVSDLSAPASRLVLSYQARSWRIGLVRRAMRWLWRVLRQPDPLAGEPWRSLWSPGSIRGLMQDNGFDVVSDDDLHTLGTGLDLPSGNGGSLRNGRVTVAVRR